MTRPTSSTERLAVLHGLVSELASLVDRALLYDAVVAGARRLVDGAFAVALSWDPARRELLVEATASGLPGVGKMSAAELASCAGPAFSSGSTVAYDDLEEHPRAASFARRLGLGSAVAVPIPRHGDGPPLGAFCVAVERGEPPLGVEEIQALELYATYSGTALTHAENVAGSLLRVARAEQLTVALRGLSHARERDAILEKGLETATSFLGADRAAIYLANGREELAFVAARGLSRMYVEFAGQRYRQSVGALLPLARAPVYVADMQNDPRTRVLHELAAQEGVRSVLFVPMLRAGRLHGAVALYHDLVWPYEVDDMAHARSLADELAIALVNSAVQEGAAREVARWKALDRLAHQLLDGSGFRRAMQTVVDEGVAGAVWLWNQNMQLLADAGPAEPGSEEAVAVGRAALDSGRPSARATPWGVLAAIPVRQGGQIVAVVAVAERRRTPVPPSPPTLHLRISDESDVTEPQALVAGVALHIGAALGHHFGREPHARAGTGKP